jgi:hypothetical protein
MQLFARTIGLLSPAGEIKWAVCCWCRESHGEYSFSQVRTLMVEDEAVSDSSGFLT